MSELTAYTPLESLLLFQALRADGVTSISFSRISDQLKSIPLIRNDPTYDGGRLSPDALRELYLRLLKDEVRGDLEQQAAAAAQDAAAEDRSVVIVEGRVTREMVETARKVSISYRFLFVVSC